MPKQSATSSKEVFRKHHFCSLSAVTSADNAYLVEEHFRQYCEESGCGPVGPLMKRPKSASPCMSEISYWDIEDLEWHKRCMRIPEIPNSIITRTKPFRSARDPTNEENLQRKVIDTYLDLYSDDRPPVFVKIPRPPPEPEPIVEAPKGKKKEKERKKKKKKGPIYYEWDTVEEFAPIRREKLPVFSTKLAPMIKHSLSQSQTLSYELYQGGSQLYKPASISSLKIASLHGQFSTPLSSLALSGKSAKSAPSMTSSAETDFASSAFATSSEQSVPASEKLAKAKDTEKESAHLYAKSPRFEAKRSTVGGSSADFSFDLEMLACYGEPWFPKGVAKAPVPIFEALLSLLVPSTSAITLVEVIEYATMLMMKGSKIPPELREEGIKRMIGLCSHSSFLVRERCVAGFPDITPLRPDVLKEELLNTTKESFRRYSITTKTELLNILQETALLHPVESVNLLATIEKIQEEIIKRIDDSEEGSKTLQAIENMFTSNNLRKSCVETTLPITTAQGRLSPSSSRTNLGSQRKYIIVDGHRSPAPIFRTVRGLSLYSESILDDDAGEVGEVKKEGAEEETEERGREAEEERARERGRVTGEERSRERGRVTGEERSETGRVAGEERRHERGREAGEERRREAEEERRREREPEAGEERRSEREPEAEEEREPEAGEERGPEVWDVGRIMREHRHLEREPRREKRKKRGEQRQQPEQQMLQEQVEEKTTSRPTSFRPPGSPSRSFIFPSKLPSALWTSPVKSTSSMMSSTHSFLSPSSAGFVPSATVTPRTASTTPRTPREAPARSTGSTGSGSPRGVTIGGSTAVKTCQSSAFTSDSRSSLHFFSSSDEDSGDDEELSDSSFKYDLPPRKTESKASSKVNTPVSTKPRKSKIEFKTRTRGCHWVPGEPGLRVAHETVAQSKGKCRSPPFPHMVQPLKGRMGVVTTNCDSGHASYGKLTLGWTTRRPAVATRSLATLYKRGQMHQLKHEKPGLSFTPHGILPTEFYPASLFVACAKMTPHPPAKKTERCSVQSLRNLPRHTGFRQDRPKTHHTRPPMICGPA